MKFIEKYRKQLIIALIVITIHLLIFNLYFKLNNIEDAKNIYIHFLSPFSNSIFLFYLIHNLYYRYYRK